MVDLVGAADVGSLLNRAPDTIVRVAVAAAERAAVGGEDASPDRVVDLTAAGVAPDGFTPPGRGDGRVVDRARRPPACRLASGDADGIGARRRGFSAFSRDFGSVPGGLVVVSDASPATRCGAPPTPSRR